MIYNVYISYITGSYNILGLSEEKLKKVVNHYLHGDDNFMLAGKKYFLTKVKEFRIFTYESERDFNEVMSHYEKNIHYSRKSYKTRYLPPQTLLMIGKDVTNDYIGDSRFGELLLKAEGEKSEEIFINLNRIDALKNIVNSKFDLIRLIKLCEELNINYQSRNFLSVGMIGRTILNHIPPIFGFKTFDEVASNYGSLNDKKSFKKNMMNLKNSLKNISDSYLHQTIRDKESLPNETQVEFRSDMDVLLEEIVRLLK